MKTVQYGGAIKLRRKHAEKIMLARTAPSKMNSIGEGFILNAGNAARTT